MELNLKIGDKVINVWGRTGKITGISKEEKRIKGRIVPCLSVDFVYDHTAEYIGNEYFLIAEFRTEEGVDIEIQGDKYDSSFLYSIGNYIFGNIEYSDLEKNLEYLYREKEKIQENIDILENRKTLLDKLSKNKKE